MLDKTPLLDLIKMTRKAKTDELCTIIGSKKNIMISAKRNIQVNCRASTEPLEETLPLNRTS